MFVLLAGGFPERFDSNEDIFGVLHCSVFSQGYQPCLLVLNGSNVPDTDQ